MWQECPTLKGSNPASNAALSGPEFLSAPPGALPPAIKLCPFRASIELLKQLIGQDNDSANLLAVVEPLERAPFCAKRLLNASRGTLQHAGRTRSEIGQALFDQFGDAHGRFVAERQPFGFQNQAGNGRGIVAEAVVAGD